MVYGPKSARVICGGTLDGVPWSWSKGGDVAVGKQERALLEVISVCGVGLFNLDGMP